MLNLQNLNHWRENNRLEAKLALGGLPESLWETYSAFANAQGGLILLGVEELPDKTLRPVDLLDPQWMLEDFRAILTDPERVSVNLLTESNLQVHCIDGKHIIAITVPRASESQKPVYLDGDPYRGSYIRRGEGDYRLTKEEVDEMLLRAKQV